MASKRPFFVIVPGGSQNPAHYAYLTHLILLAGYPVYSAPLPSVGNSRNVTLDDDTAFVRERMILPILDHEEHDVIFILHSYSGLPGGAATLGLDKESRLAQGEKTGVIGQIYMAAFLIKGGDGIDLITWNGGNSSETTRIDEDANLMRCDYRLPLYHDAEPKLLDALAASVVPHGLACFKSAPSRASWDSEGYKGRVAYVRALQDQTVPLPVQQMFIEGTGVDWIVKDIESGHSPQASQPERLVEIVLELAKVFEAL